MQLAAPGRLYVPTAQTAGRELIEPDGKKYPASPARDGDDGFCVSLGGTHTPRGGKHGAGRGDTSDGVEHDGRYTYTPQCRSC